MQSDPGTEWERLTRLYAEKGDEELVDLSEDFGNLTEVAQQVLRDEMRKRKLEAPAGNAEDSGSAKAIADGKAFDYACATPLCECNTGIEATMLAKALDMAKIQSWIQYTNMPRKFALRYPRVWVASDQLEEARIVAAGQLPREIVEEAEVMSRDFVPPTCPKCGAADPLLESVEPSNAWLCENCGARWSDPGPVENAGQNPT